MNSASKTFVGRTAAAVLLLSMAALSYGQETDYALVLVGGMDGPDPDRYPVTETVTRWMESTIGDDSVIKFRIMDETVSMEGFGDFYQAAYSMGADKLVFGFYEIDGSEVVLRLGSTDVDLEGLVSDLGVELTGDEGALRFDVSRLDSGSLPPPHVSYMAHSLAASVYYNLGQYEKALEQINLAIEYGSEARAFEVSRLYSLRATIRGSKYGLHEAALADLDTALVLDATNDVALSNRAFVLFLLRRYEEALEAYDLRIEVHPEVADAYFDRADFLEQLGYYEDALTGYRKALELIPDHPDYLYKIALCQAYMQDFESAIQSYGELIDLYPLYMDAHADRAILQIDMGEYETAQENLMEALELDDSFARLYNALVLNCFYLGEYEDVIEYAEIGERLDPTDQNFPKAAGGAYMRMGDFDSALQEFELAYAVIMTYHGGVDDPRSTADNLRELIEELREISEMDPGSSTYFYARASQFSEIGMYREAVDELTEAIEIDPEFEDAYYLRALCLKETGEYQQAAEDLEYVISVTASSVRANMARQLLQQLTE